MEKWGNIMLYIDGFGDRIRTSAGPEVVFHLGTFQSVTAEKKDASRSDSLRHSRYDDFVCNVFQFVLSTTAPMNNFYELQTRNNLNKQNV